MDDLKEIIKDHAERYLDQHENFEVETKYGTVYVHILRAPACALAINNEDEVFRHHIHAKMIIKELEDQLLEAQAAIFEYRHALEAVVDCGSCRECIKVSESAITAQNKEMCKELVKDRIEP